MLKFFLCLMLFSSCSFYRVGSLNAPSKEENFKNEGMEKKREELEYLLELSKGGQEDILKQILKLADKYERIKDYEESYSVYEFVLKKNLSIFEREATYLAKVDNLLKNFYTSNGYDRSKLTKRYLFLTDLFPYSKYTPSWLLNLGDLYFEEREFMDAQVHYERLIKYYSEHPQAIEAHFRLINLLLVLAEEKKERGDYLFEARVQYLLLQKVLPSRKNFKNKLGPLEKKLTNQQAGYLFYLAKFYEKEATSYSVEKLEQLMRSYPKAEIVEKARRLHRRLKKLL